MSKYHKILQRGLAFLFQVHEKFKACGNSKKSCSSLLQITVRKYYMLIYSSFPRTGYFVCLR